VPFWASFGLFNDSHYDFFGGLLLLLYCLIAQVILVNLLVAIYADQYSKVLDLADAESAKMRYASIFDYRAVKLTIPPPFNAPWTIAHFVRILFTYVRDAVGGGPLDGDPSSARRGLFGSARVVPIGRKFKFPCNESVDALQARQRYLLLEREEGDNDDSQTAALGEIRDKQTKLEDGLIGLRNHSMALEKKMDEIADLIKKSVAPPPTPTPPASV